MLDLLCPVCGGRLARKEKAWRCENHHCFDVARSGYVNLLPPSASGKRHGDDKRMVAARTAFLSRGYYDHLIGAVAGSCAHLVILSVSADQAAVQTDIRCFYCRHKFDLCTQEILLRHAEALI